MSTHTDTGQRPMCTGTGIMDTITSMEDQKTTCIKDIHTTTVTVTNMIMTSSRRYESFNS